MDSLVIFCSLIACVCSPLLTIRLIFDTKTAGGAINRLLVIGLITTTNIIAVSLLVRLAAQVWS